jgi:hypothetical protein
MTIQRNSGMVVALLALAGGYWYLTRNKAAAATPTTVLPSNPLAPPAPVSGALAPTGSQISAASAVWSNLTATSGPTSGYVNFPSGSQAAAAFLPWATDGAGNYYTQWAGQIYIVGVGYTDSNGNYTAKLLGT